MNTDFRKVGASRMPEVMNATVMGFVKIAETYPDEYVLVRIVEIDHDKGRETGMVIYTAPTWEELEVYARNEGIIEETTIVQGENLVPIIGGFL